jgi:hypothetical protein
MSHRKSALSVLATAALVFVACGGEADVAETETAEAQPAPAVSVPAVMITQPANDAVIEGNSVVVMLEVSDLMIAPAGTMDAGTGHHHLVVDTDLPEAGVAIPSTPGVHIHMGKAQTEMELTDLAPGEHIVIAVVGDGAHVPLDPWVADTVRFVVP